ncbi:Putative auxin efflux carrier component 5 [Apostasia shenzhenica]|uniref:Auxin efflux carrier component 5 n=1 Tax=Apostasia shenzhenica TaxID=1088818 RepID=A0A2I0AP72_9ASPA|nr:Putative auxin efflux carrier component 5 [Apostasia shenzhenica]
MISLADVYHVLEATVPLYVAMMLAYLSVRWWKLFSSEECSTINKFVAKISIPLLSYQVISMNNPYQMNLKLILADIVQKILALFIFLVISKLLDLVITGFSVCTLPNTLIVGIPLLRGMYGEEAAKILAQIVVLQSLVWYTILLFLFEYRAAEVTVETPSENTGDALLVLSMVGRKLMKNPNTYACLVGLIWALVSYRWGFVLPTIIKNSISIISNGGLGMAMFSLGLFMASQSRIIACSYRMMIFSMVLRCIVGPAFMAIPSYSLKMKGTLLKVALIQAALPQGIVPFVFAKEYGLHPDILSTG